MAYRRRRSYSRRRRSSSRRRYSRRRYSRRRSYSPRSYNRAWTYRHATPHVGCTMHATSGACGSDPNCDWQEGRGCVRRSGVSSGVAYAGPMIPAGMTLSPVDFGDKKGGHRRSRRRSTRRRHSRRRH